MLGALLATAALAGTLWLANRERSLPLLLLGLTFAYLYLVRAWVVLLRLDEPFPEELFSLADVAPLTNELGAVLCLYLVVLVATHHALKRLPISGSALLPYFRQPLRPSVMLIGVAACTVIALAIAAWLVASAGGVDAAIRAAKVDKNLGHAVLRIPATVGAIVSAVAFVERHTLVRPGTQTSIISQLLAGSLIVNCAASALWGSRLIPVLMAAFVLGYPALQRSSGLIRRITWVRVGVFVLIVSMLVLGLRFGRDTLLAGETFRSGGTASTTRVVTISGNTGAWDASMLAVRDWPARFDFRGGVDFTNGVLGVVPERLLPSSPDPAVGRWFRQVYEPGTENGWPVGTPMEWFVNFGWLGVVAGGLLSGLLYRIFTNAARRAPGTSLNIMGSLLLCLLVFPLGLQAVWLGRYLVLIVPIIALYHLTRATWLAGAPYSPAPVLTVLVRGGEGSDRRFGIDR